MLTSRGVEPRRMLAGRKQFTAMELIKGEELSWRKFSATVY